MESMWRSIDEPVTRSLPRVLRAVLPALCLCCSEAKEPPSEEPDAGNDAAALDPSIPLLGTFAVTLVAPSSTTDGFTSVLGRVYDAPMPDQLAWDIADSAQGCELRIPVVPFCEPSCGTSAVCTEERGCVAYPAARDLGTVTVTGLQASAIEMKPVAGTYQLPPEIALPHPPTAEGAPIRLQGGAGAVGPFEIKGKGIAPLQLLGPEVLPLDGTAPLFLEWQPPSDTAASRIQVKVDISHHGGLKGVIECDVEDDGQSEIEAPLLEQLIGLGTAGFPTINVTRVATGGTRLDSGRVLLTVLSRVERALDVPGVVSCNDDDECSTGQTCATSRICEGP
jgi:hypothetical protein